MSDRDTITLPREVVEGALEALCHARSRLDHAAAEMDCNASVDALRTALAAEPTKQEPVAVFDEQMGHPVLLLGSPMLKDKQPLYTAPPDAEALRRDAERYRWLQDAGQKYWMEFADMTAEATEAAIDAAMEGKR